MEKGFGIGVAIVVVTVAMFVVLGVEIGLMPAGTPALLGSVLIPTGGVLHPSVTRFEVPEPAGRVVGAWYADHGGFVLIQWANETFLPPLPCYGSNAWRGSIDQLFVAGSYNMTFVGVSGDTLTVTESIRVMGATGAGATNFWVAGSTCA